MSGVASVWRAEEPSAWRVLRELVEVGGEAG